MTDETDDKTLQEEIERRAYRRFCNRGHEHGAALDDWLAAECEVLAAKNAIPPDRTSRAEATPKARRKPRVSAR